MTTHSIHRTDRAQPSGFQLVRSGLARQRSIAASFSPPSHVLVVDDDPETVGVLSAALDLAGYTVHSAYSGPEAIAFLENARWEEDEGVDLILLDLMMPGMNGIEVCRWVRSQPALAQVPVLVLTAYHTAQDRLTALEVGANDYVAKPFDTVELLARVNNLVRWYRAEREAQAEMRRRNEELQALNRIATTLNQTLKLPDLLQQTLTTVCQVTGLPRGTIYLLQSGTETLELVAHQGLPRALLQGVQRVSRDGSAMWRIIEQMQPFSITTLSIPPHQREGIPGRPSQITWASILLAAKGQAMGVMNLGDYGHWSLPTEKAPLLGAIGHQIGAAVANARLYARAQRRVAELTTLREVALELANNLDLPVLLQQIAEHAAYLLNAYYSGLFLLDAEEVFLELAAGHRLPAPWAEGRLRADRGLMGQVLSTRRSIAVRNYDPRREAEWLDQPPFSRFLAAPMVLRDRVLGVLIVGDHQPRPPFEEDDRWLLSLLAGQAASAVENARLYQEVRQFAAELERSQAQLIQSEKLAAMGRLAASLAHEINNPLQAIHNCVRLALDFPLSDEEKAKYLRMADREIKRLVHIVQRMLEFYRPSRGEAEATDLNALVEQVLALTHKQIQQNKIALETDLAADLPLVSVVADQIMQVILNLVVNAIEAMETGGRLWVSTRRQGDDVLLSIRDTGPGLTPEQRTKLFEPFYTTKQTGTGLGLAVSYGIVEKHGGTIEVESEPGRGATFTIRLPWKRGGS